MQPGDVILVFRRGKSPTEARFGSPAPPSQDESGARGDVLGLNELPERCRKNSVRGRTGLIMLREEPSDARRGVGEQSLAESTESSSASTDVPAPHPNSLSRRRLPIGAAGMGKYASLSLSLSRRAALWDDILGSALGTLSLQHGCTQQRFGHTCEGVHRRDNKVRIRATSSTRGTTLCVAFYCSHAEVGRG